MHILIPVALSKKEKSNLEKEDFEAWKELRGFSDDDGDLFHKFYKWVPPRHTPEEMTDEEFTKKLKQKKV